MSTPALSTPWVPLYPVSAAPVVPTPVDGYWLQGGPDGAMSWQPAPVPPPGLVTPDTNWQVLGTDVGFQNGWTNYADPYGPARYRKLASGIVVMEGLIRAGTEGATAITLPAGWRPAPQAGGGLRDRIFQCATAAGTAPSEAVRVYSSGELRPISPGTSGWTDLSGIIFLAA